MSARPFDVLAARASAVRDGIRLAVREAMQNAEELGGCMETAEYVALMKDIGRDAYERAARAAATDQESRVREADALIDKLLAWQAKYVTDGLIAAGSGSQSQSRAEVDAAREALIEFLTRSAAT